MTEQPVVPPPHVWNRIEKILSEQDKAKAFANNSNTMALAFTMRPAKKKPHAIFTVLGFAVFICIILTVV